MAYGPMRLLWVVGVSVLLGCGGAAQQPPAQPNATQPNATATVRVHVQLRCDGPCQAIERSCETACDHMGYDSTPGHDQQHCRDECFDNESECVRDCQGG